MSGYRFPDEIRGLILEALPEEPIRFGEVPELRYTYVPAGHARALHPDSMLVVGMRGAGKTFWWSALQNPEHRRLVAEWLPRAGITENTRVSIGYGERAAPFDYPGRDTLARLLDRYDPRQVWRTVVLHKLSSDGPLSARKTWPERVEWVMEHPEEVELLLYGADQTLVQEGRHHLILFDALDRTADDWPTMNQVVRGLLQVLLEFRAYRRIRPKAFVRPDHIDEAAVGDFPDASKVLTQKVELRWPRYELYGLLFQYLANEESALFREGCEEGFGLRWERTEQGVWSLPKQLRVDETLQRKVFHAITGPWMGRDRRRGFPYTWLPNHLGDAHRQVSPRSFLAAVRRAAQDPPRESYEWALFYESIKRGVQEASRIRVKEMQEDYPWVKLLMDPLAELTVPVAFEPIVERWKASGVLAHLVEAIQNEKVKLPPAHWDEGPEGIRKDLEALGVFERMSDGRVNVPDVYRVGYGLRRRGGVKPSART